jgi:hypothetical protein
MRGTVRQRKTGRPVRFELTGHACQAVDIYLKVCRKKPGDYRKMFKTLVYQSLVD